MQSSVVFKSVWVGLAVLFLCVLGCDQGASDGSGSGTGGTGDSDHAAGEPGEIVVEASETTVLIDGEETPTSAIIAALVTEEEVEVPIGYVLTVDEAFDQPRRARLVVTGEPGIEAVTPESIRDATDPVYESLAFAFAARTEQAMRDRLASLRDEAEEANKATREAQAAFESFLASQRGLPVTGASRDRRIRLNGLLDRALDREGELGEQVQLLEREIRRQLWPTLRRVR